jgi:hypothetical protein
MSNLIDISWITVTQQMQLLGFRAFSIALLFSGWSLLDWTKLSRFHLTQKTESSLRNVVFETMDNGSETQYTILTNV